MRQARVGQAVTISPYDWYSTDAPYPDDPEDPATHIRTVGERGGTVYAIVSIRRVIPRKRLPRGCRRRYVIQAVKLGKVGTDGFEIPNDGRVISLRWTPRNAQTGRH
jgi:hypothetical protein